MKIETNFSPSVHEIQFHEAQLWKAIQTKRPDFQGEKRRTCSLIARDGSNNIIGGAYIYSFLGNAVLESIWIEPGHRGHGYSTELVNKIFEIAKSWGCFQMVCFTSDFLGAMALCEKHGGVQFGKIENPEKDFSVVYYCRRL